MPNVGGGIGANITSWLNRSTSSPGTFAGGPFNGHSSLTTGLVSYWALENTADSKGSNTLTNTGTVTFAAGKHNNAASFSGAGEQTLSRGGASGLSISAVTGFTMSGWFRQTNIGVARAWLSKFDIGNNLYEYLLYNTGGNLTFDVIGGTGDYGDVTSTSSGALANATWYFVIAGWDPTDQKCFLKVDGGAATQGSALPSPPYNDNSVPFLINADAGAGPTAILIDEVGLWNRVLSSQERSDLYNAGAGLFY
jgi:concanavalin A-like lectin/glucanase superfamily protein